MFKYKKSIIIGGSKGLGREISKNLKKISKKIISCSRSDIDTSDLKSVKNFLKKHKSVDILVLNSGGPPPLKFNEISEKNWYKYFTQLFLGFCVILQNIKIRNGGYVFYISSSIIKEPDANLILSSSMRSGFSSVIKSLSSVYAQNNISLINIAPGPFKTQRVKELVKKNISEYENKLPMKKLGDPSEIGKFVEFVVKNEIKYLAGSTIYFDGNTLKSL